MSLWHVVFIYSQLKPIITVSQSRPWMRTSEPTLFHAKREHLTKPVLFHTRCTHALQSQPFFMLDVKCSTELALFHAGCKDFPIFIRANLFSWWMIRCHANKWLPIVSHSVMLTVTKNESIHHHSLLRGTTPSLSLKYPNFTLDNNLVNTSATCSFVAMYWSFTAPFSTISWIYWYFISMCLDLSWTLDSLTTLYNSSCHNKYKSHPSLDQITLITSFKATQLRY